jgi:hypothetical protein
MFLFSFASLSTFGQGQNVYYLYPVEDAVTTFQFPNQNWGNHNQLSAYAWTQQFALSIHRSYIKYNLSSFSNPNAITSATLKLAYFDPVGYPNSGANSFRVSLSSSNWSENSITWNNQPSPSTSFIDHPSSSGYVNVNVNVTSLVRQAIQNNNYGFIIQLLDESPYKMVLFGSRENEGATPVLEIQTLNDVECDTLKSPNDLEIINLNSALGNLGISNPSILQVFRNNLLSGNEIGRVFIRPSLRRIPANSVITASYLNLNILSLSGQPNSGANELILHPLISAVPSSIVSWNTTQQYDSLTTSIGAQSLGTSGAYTINTNNLTSYSVLTNSSFGYIMKLANENTSSTPRAFFAGPGQTNGQLNPEYIVCYIRPTGLKNSESSRTLVYPNPTDGFCTVELTQPIFGKFKVGVYSSIGKLAFSDNLEINEETNRINLQLDFLSTGLYLIVLEGPSYKYTSKVHIRN